MNMRINDSSRAKSNTQDAWT